MSTSVRLLSVLAGSIVLVVTTWVVGPRLPEPFHMVDGGWLISIALVVYVIALIMLALCAAGVLQVREVLRSRHKVIFSACGMIVIAYTILASIALYGISQATDL